MKKRSKHTVLIICALAVSIISAKSFYTGEFLKIPLKGKIFTTDNLGNIFLVKHDNSIVKFNKNGVQQAAVNFKIYGNLTQLDVSNPFEIYAYYRDQQTVLILDNQLSHRSSISLNNITTGEISTACRSFDNGLWYFDSGNMKLFKADKSLNVTQESMPLATWTSKVWMPNQMLDNEKYVFLHDSTNGIAIFDIFSNYYKTVDFKGLKDFQVKKSKIYFYETPYFQSFDFKLLSYDTISYALNYQNVRMDGDQLYLWKNDSLQIQPIK